MEINKLTNTWENSIITSSNYRSNFEKYIIQDPKLLSFSLFSNESKEEKNNTLINLRNRIRNTLNKT